MEYIDIANEDCSKIKKNMLAVDDRNFFHSITERGREYYKQGRVSNLMKVNAKDFTAIVNGSEKYNVYVSIRNRHYEITSATNCTCPFNQPDGYYINNKLCKHIYATCMAIYELENKEYLKNAIKEYSEKYSLLYLEITNKIDNLKLNSKDKNFCKKYKKEFTELYKAFNNTFNDELTSQMILDLLCELIVKSAEILDLLQEINISYENNLEKENIEDEHTNKDIIEAEENKKITEPNESFIIRFFEVLSAILVGIFTGLFSSSKTEDSSEEESIFSHGDTVIVKYSGKVGVIVSVSGNYYTVKLKDEFENEYYASYYGNELESYY